MIDIFLHSLSPAFTPLVANIPIILLVWLVLRQLQEQVINVLRVSDGLFFYLAHWLAESKR